MGDNSIARLNRAILCHGRISYTIPCAVGTSLAFPMRRRPPDVVCCGGGRYGRYTAVARRARCSLFFIPARLFWILMEVPNLISVVWCIQHARPAMLAGTANKLLLGMFTLHYLHR